MVSRARSLVRPRLLRARPLSLVLAPLLAACSPPAPAPVRWMQAGMPAAPSPPAAPPVDPRAPLVIPETRGAPAPWLEPTLRRSMNPLASPKQVAAGKRTAVVELADYEHDYAYSSGTTPTVTDRPKVPRAFVLVTEAEGVLGPLVSPVEPSWIGVDGDDQIFVAGEDGDLYAAASAEDARSGRFERRADRPGATRWDAGQGLLAAAARDELSLSDDAGKSFHVVRPKKGQSILALALRFDGVIAVQVEDRKGKRTVLTSADGGKSFRASKYQPKTIVREGAWIWTGDADCPATLDADGRAFVIDQQAYEAFRDRRRWSTQVMGNDGARGFFPAEPVDRLDLPALPDPKAGGALGDPAACEERPRGGIGGILGSMADPRDCVGARCLRDAFVETRAAGPRAALLLSDGECDRLAGPGKRWCADDARLVRAPHWALVDRRSGVVETIARLPAPCDPARVYHHRGIEALVCGTGPSSSAIYTLAPGPTFTREIDLPMAASAITAVSGAADGTLLFHLACAPVDASCRAFVRAPLAIGDNRAYRVLDVPGAQAYRALEGGAALAFIASPDGRQLALGLSRADGTYQSLTPFTAALDGILNASITASRNVELTLRAGPGVFEQRSVWVTNGGGLVDAPRRAVGP
ncbi:MAG: hypothetical protein U0359_16475 [Byssovorax sp.]